jgi:MYND finger
VSVVPAPSKSTVMAQAARILPDVLKCLVSKASEGDVCEDAMSYVLTLISFLMSESGCEEPDSLDALVEAAADAAWLKVVMRIWKDDIIVGHVPGVEKQHLDIGLGFLVTVFLDRIVCGVYSKAGVRSITGMRLWPVSFIAMRLFKGYISSEERLRLMRVLLTCAKYDPEFALTLVHGDSRTVDAVSGSILSIKVDQSSCPREAEGALLQAASVGSSIFAHLQVFAHAFASGSESSRLAFMACAASMESFWTGLFHAAEVLAGVAAHDTPSLYDDLANVLALSCSLSLVSDCVWHVAEWLSMPESSVTEAITIAHPSASSPSLSRQEISQRLSSLSRLLCHLSPSSAIQARCAINLTSSAPVSAGAVRTAAKVERVCEWCFSIDTAQGDGKRDGSDVGRQQACGRCKQVYFCGVECIRKHWKHSHKRGCAFISASAGSEDCAGQVYSIGGVSVRYDSDGQLIDDNRNSSLAKEYSMHGAEVVLRRYGSIAADIGCGIQIMDSKSANTDETSASVKFVPRGVLLREEILRRARQAQAKNAIADISILRSMMDTGLALRRLCTFASVLIEGQPPSFQVFRVHCARRTLPPRLVTAQCDRRGCDHHDGRCTSRMASTPGIR